MRWSDHLPIFQAGGGQCRTAWDLPNMISKHCKEDSVLYFICWPLCPHTGFFSSMECPSYFLSVMSSISLFTRLYDDLVLMGVYIYLDTWVQICKASSRFRHFAAPHELWLIHPTRRLYATRSCLSVMSICKVIWLLSPHPGLNSVPLAQIRGRDGNILSAMTAVDPVCNVNGSWYYCPG